MPHHETELLFHSDTNTPRNSSESTKIEIYKEGRRLSVKNQQQLKLTKLWTFSILFLALYSVLVTVLWLRSQFASRRIHCQQWRATDLEAAHPAIDIVERKFTTGIRSFQNGTLYRSYDPSEPTYVGPPSPEIDANWDEIVNLDTQAFYVMPEEATSLPGQPYRFNRSGVYEVELEVFHSLHCLNLIRKEVHRDYYSSLISTRPFWAIHIEHCIEALRQNIMCTGDLTPLPLTYVNGIMPDFEQPHTCRDFNKIVQWAKARDATTSGVAKDNLQRLKSVGT